MGIGELNCALREVPKGENERLVALVIALRKACVALTEEIRQTDNKHGWDKTKIDAEAERRREIYARGDLKAVREEADFEFRRWLHGKVVNFVWDG